MQDRIKYLILPIAFAFLFITCHLLYFTHKYNDLSQLNFFVAFWNTLPEILGLVFLAMTPSFMTIILLFCVQYQKPTLNLWSSITYLAILVIVNFIIINPLFDLCFSYTLKLFQLINNRYLYIIINFIFYALVITTTALISFIYFKDNNQNDKLSLPPKKTILIIVCNSILFGYLIFRMLTHTTFHVLVEGLFNSFGHSIGYGLTYCISLLCAFISIYVLFYKRLATCTPLDNYATKTTIILVCFDAVICIILLLIAYL